MTMNHEEANALFESMLASANKPLIQQLSEDIQRQQEQVKPEPAQQPAPAEHKREYHTPNMNDYQAAQRFNR